MNIKLPVPIGNNIYWIEQWNKYYKTGEKYETSYGITLTIVKKEVEGYIIDKDGITIAEDGWDGWDDASNYYENKKGNIIDSPWFKTKKEALDYIEIINKGEDIIEDNLEISIEEDNLEIDIEEPFEINIEDLKENI